MSAGEQPRARRGVNLTGLFRSQVSAEIPNKTCRSDGSRAGPGRAPKKGSEAHSHLWLQRQTEPEPAPEALRLGLRAWLSQCLLCGTGMGGGPALSVIVKIN